jgi:hypothetical protein
VRARSIVFAALAAAGCPKSERTTPTPTATSTATAAVTTTTTTTTTMTTAATSTRDATVDASASAGARAILDASDDAAALHRESRQALLELFTFDAGAGYLSWVVGYGSGKMNQGNKAISSHAISKRACLERLEGVVLQTPEQRATCGAENMVPIWEGGDPAKAKYCIDVFEFPNIACELPFVWMTPAQAARICAYQGKRLCSQQEWNMACRADPKGGADQVYAYGNQLDLDVCNTNKPHPMADAYNWKCYVRDAQTAWETCGTDTEPSGSYPRCRSRFGVFDQHGNVAEIMTRKEGDVVYTQLKGSAFFYVDVARRHDEPHPPGRKRDTYPDHCNYDPRWHVEVLENALHMNYHLGFRCCKTIDAR